MADDVIINGMPHELPQEPPPAPEPAPRQEEPHETTTEAPAETPLPSAAEAFAAPLPEESPLETEAEDKIAAVATEEPPPPTQPQSKKRWYVVKVTSGREDSIKESIERRMRKEGLEEYFGQIVIPVEKITEVKPNKAGRRVTRIKERKLYPGYLMCEVEYNDRILYLFRETSGVGDFVGSHPGQPEREPTPMTEREIQRMMGTPQPGEGTTTIPTKPKDLDVGDRVRVEDGTFKDMEGQVKSINEGVGKVQVELAIFGRPVTIDLEYYQVERV